MPFLQLHYASLDTLPSPDTLARTLTSLTAEHLHKRADLTTVVLQPVPPLHWWAGGVVLGAGTARAGYGLRIDVTDGVDPDTDVARYLDAVHHALAELFGPGLHPASYVIVQGQPAARWGWSGRTQAARRGAG